MLARTTIQTGILRGLLSRYHEPARMAAQLRQKSNPELKKGGTEPPFQI